MLHLAFHLRLGALHDRAGRRHHCQAEGVLTGGWKICLNSKRTLEPFCLFLFGGGLQLSPKPLLLTSIITPLCSGFWTQTKRMDPPRPKPNPEPSGKSLPLPRVVGGLVLAGHIHCALRACPAAPFSTCRIFLGGPLKNVQPPKRAVFPFTFQVYLFDLECRCSPFLGIRVMAERGKPSFGLP